MSKSMNNVAKTMDCTDIEFTKHAISLLTRLQEYKNKHPESFKWFNVRHYEFSTNQNDVDNLVKEVKESFGVNLNVYDADISLVAQEKYGVNFKFVVNTTNTGGAKFNDKSFMRMCISKGFDNVFDTLIIRTGSGGYSESDPHFTRLK